MKFYLPNNSEERYSFRSRGYLILEQLGKTHGYISDLRQFINDDLYVVGKKFTTKVLETLIDKSIHFVIDINDYKLQRKEEKQLYLEAVKHAVAITTTCDFLAERIRVELNTNLPIYVIPDPTERSRVAPVYKSFEPGDTINLVWYGARKNLFHLDLNDIKLRLENLNYKINLDIITNKKPEDPIEWIEWSYDAQEELVKKADFVFMPVSDKPKHEIFVKSKGNNRPVDAIQQGKFVLTNRTIPSYLELGKYLYAGDVFEGLTFAITNPKVVYDKIASGQKHIEKNYLPAIIAQKWLEVEKNHK